MIKFEKWLSRDPTSPYEYTWNNESRRSRRR